jgi:hypothetical protein
MEAMMAGTSFQTKLSIKTSIICLAAALLASPASAQTETRAQKLKYIKDITGVSCSAEQLPLYASPGGKASGTVPAPASVTIIRGRLDGKGESWVFVSNDKAKKKTGWVKLDALNCI